MCGRDRFTQKSPHQCNHGFRKKGIKWEKVEFQPMDYFPPKDMQGEWGTCTQHDNGRMGFFKGYYMSTSCVKGKWRGNVWTHKGSNFSFSVHSRAIYKTEKDAADWCESKVIEDIGSRENIDSLKARINYCIKDLKLDGHPAIESLETFLNNL